MLPPIPPQLLKSTIRVEAAVSVDQERRTKTLTYTVKRVHLQPGSIVRKTQTDTGLTLRSTLFVDGRISAPALDWAALLQTAQSVGGDVTVTQDDQVYTVASVERIPDDEGNLHHWEIGLM